MPILAYALPSSVTHVELTWQAPTTYTDGSAVQAGDIAGYYVYWRTPTGTYNDADKIAVSSTSLPSTSLPALNGRYVFAVTAHDINNVESGFSGEVEAVGNNGQWSPKTLGDPNGLRWK